MFDKVLLPIDVTHHASWEKALPMALDMVKDGGTLHVLGIVHDIGAAILSSYLPADFEEKALLDMKAKLEAFIAEKVPSGTQAEAHVAHGHVPEHILSEADRLDADLIVIASHPPNELRSVLIGSNADRIVRHATRPVLVVR